jgi:hypothetical protein
MDVRVGIEAESVAVGEGILLYCLYENCTSTVRGTIYGRIGHLSLIDARRRLDAVMVSDGPLRAFDGSYLKFLDENKEPEATARFVFLREIYGVRPGVFQIALTETLADGKQFMEKSPKEYATISITVGGKQAYHAWTPLMGLKARSKPTARDQFYATSRRNGIALPRVDGTRAIAATKFGKDAALPGLLPQHQSPGFSIQKEQDVLLVRRSNGLRRWGPLGSLLARWWVNGREVIFQQVPFDERKRGEITLDGFPARAREWRIHLHLNLAVLGAKSGDTIGMQLLYSPDDWDWVAPGISMASSEGDDPRAFPELSNRINFIASE